MLQVLAGGRSRMLSSKLLEDDVGCVAGHSLVRPWSCVLASAKRYGLLSSLATIPLWPNVGNTVQLPQQQQKTSTKKLGWRRLNDS
eukprot:3460325-Amphidinium_carterae.1